MYLDLDITLGMTDVHAINDDSKQTITNTSWIRGKLVGKPGKETADQVIISFAEDLVGYRS